MSIFVPMRDQAVSVSELTYAIKGLLEEGIGDVLVSGEISNFKEHSSGHRYFTLKDADAQIGAVMWRTRSLTFRPEDGMRVVVRGRLSVYPPQGKYQIDCSAMRPEGVGDLHRAFEQLREALRVRGLFDADRKKPIPHRPRSVGIATSQTGAALQDMLSTIHRRFPLLDVVFRPTLVQGEGLPRISPARSRNSMLPSSTFSLSVEAVVRSRISGVSIPKPWRWRLQTLGHQ